MTDNRLMTRLTGYLIFKFIRLISITARITQIPHNVIETVTAYDKPLIVTFWHGHSALLAACNLTDPIHRGQARRKINLMLSRHRDTAVIDHVIRDKFGVNIIKGSGASADDRHKTVKRGGAASLYKMIKALNNGEIALLTSDVPKGPAFKAGAGIINLARQSGCPILPVAFATSRPRIILNSWDKLTIPLPFARLVAVHGDIWHIPRDDDQSKDKINDLCQQLETKLNDLTLTAQKMIAK